MPKRNNCMEYSGTGWRSSHVLTNKFIGGGRVHEGGGIRSVVEGSCNMQRLLSHVTACISS